MLVSGKNKKNFYNVIIAYITISLILLVTLVSVVFFASYNNFFISVLSGYSMDNLFQISFNVDSMIKSGDAISRQVYLDEKVQQLMYTKHQNDIESLDWLRRLGSYVSSVENIHSIYMLNGKDNQVSFVLKSLSDSNNDSGIKDISKFYDREFLNSIKNGVSNNLYPVARKISRDSNATFECVYSFILYDGRANPNSGNNAVIVNYSADSLYKTISYLDKSAESTTFIINKDNYIISNNKMHPYLTNLSGIGYIDSVQKSNKPTGYFTWNIDGSKSLITYTSSNNSNWKIIHITPYKFILSKLDRLRIISLIIYIAIVLISIGAALTISKRIYMPYNTMSEKVNSLESKKTEFAYFAKQNFLQSLLENTSIMSFDGLMKKFEALKIGLNYENPSTVILFRIDNYNSFCGKYNYNDRNIFKFGMTNITSEICNEYCISESITTDADHVAVIISTASKELINNMVAKCMEPLSGFLATTCSAAISSSGENLGCLSLMYHEALEISKYRMFKGTNSIIYSSDIPMNDAAGFEYPENKENQFLDSIKLGKPDDAKRHYDDFINLITQYDYDTFIHSITKLALSISITTDTLQKNSDIPLKISFDSLLHEISTVETIGEISEMVYSTLDKISEVKDNIRDTKNDKVIEFVKEVIDREYMDTNLTIDSLAEKTKISSSHLRLLFKRSTNISVSDYINDVRMAKARELLKNSTLSAAEISEKVGFLNRSYFFTAFKKAHGVTPNDYRTNVILTQNHR